MQLATESSAKPHTQGLHKTQTAFSPLDLRFLRSTVTFLQAGHPSHNRAFQAWLPNQDLRAWWSPGNRVGQSSAADPDWYAMCMTCICGATNPSPPGIFGPHKSIFSKLGPRFLFRIFDGKTMKNPHLDDQFPIIEGIGLTLVSWKSPP